MKSKNLLLTFLLVLFSVATAIGQSPLGTWKTIDDNSGEAKSHVEISESNGKFVGKVAKLLIKPADTVCEKCSGSKKNKPVVGMEIVWGLTPYSDYWSYGTIMDPENGKEYKCSVWFESGKPDELKVRGKHWSGVYRTQTWYRIK